jgi:hypothetical protein
MLNQIPEYGINVLEIDQRAIELAVVYIEMGIIPLKFRMDGVHIAMASINETDCIISLNFHHSNKLKTKMATEIINRMNAKPLIPYSYPAPLILSRPFLWNEPDFVWPAAYEEKKAPHVPLTFSMHLSWRMEQYTSVGEGPHTPRPTGRLGASSRSVSAPACFRARKAADIRGKSAFLEPLP